MAKRHLTQYDSSGNKQEIYLNEDEVMLEGGKTLGEKMDEIDEALEGAGSGSVSSVKVGETTYEPTEGVVDLSTPFGGKVDKENGKGLSSNDYTTQEKNKLAGLSNYDDTSLQAAVASLREALEALVGGADVQGAIDTFNEVVAFLAGISSSDTLAAKLATLVPQTRTVNGKALSSNVTIGINDIEGLAAAIAAAGSGAVSVTVPDPADGTFTIHVGSTDYTVNLNHTHPNMAKLVVCEESDLPSTYANDTIYAITDSGETEIEKLIIHGLEFAGGVAPGTPAITSPSGTSINLGTNLGAGVSKTITVKGNRFITGDITVSASSGLSLSYGQQSGSSLVIPQADAVLGVSVTVAYSGSGALADGTLTVTGGGCESKVFDVIAETPVALDGVMLTGDQWLQTDYKPNSKTEFTLLCKFSENSNTRIYPCDVGYHILYCPNNEGDGKRFKLYTGVTASNNAVGCFMLNLINEDNVQYGNGYQQIKYQNPAQPTQQTQFLTDDSSISYTIGTSNGVFKFSNSATSSQVNTSKKSTTMETNMAIGYDGTKTFGTFNLTIYSLVIREDGTTVRNYTPVSVNGVNGLLDTVGGTFISSETSTNLEPVTKND